MSIFKRKLKNGYSWRVVIRIKGYPTICETFERKQEAEDWEKETKSRIKQGQFKFDQHKKQHTFNDLVNRYINDGALEHHRSADDTLRHLTYWRQRFGKYALVHISSEFLGKERQILLETPTHKEKKRTSSTVNRYLASLSSVFTYGVKQLRWIHESPCLYLMKLKENPGRKRVLQIDEINRLFEACRESRSPYLYCIVLMALSTGARQGEILNLEWEHIDFENKFAYLQETKNGHPRSLPLPEPVIEELKVLYEKRNPSKRLVFASRSALGRIDIKKAWNQALRRAEIAHCCFHTMRHTYATHASAIGASTLVLQTGMGHRTLDMVQRYTHHKAEVVRKYNDALCQQMLGEPK